LEVVVPRDKQAPGHHSPLHRAGLAPGIKTGAKFVLLAPMKLTLGYLSYYVSLIKELYLYFSVKFL